VTATVSAWRPSVRVGTRLLCGVALAGSMLADRISGGSPDHTPPASFAVAVLAAAFVALLLPDPQPRNRPGRFVVRSLAGLAHSSYSLYAMHLPVLTLLAVGISVNGATSTWEPSVINWAILAVVVAALVGAGWAFAQVTERHTKPLTEWVLARIGVTRDDRPVPIVSS
jgi:peptidoglycan/LPS O-acetylase OafA/YrhL